MSDFHTGAKMMSRSKQLFIYAAAAGWTAALCLYTHADSLEIHNNPVADGTITVVPGDPDRSDWDGIPWYEEDFEEGLYPVDITGVQIAHDSQFVYFHLVTIEWDVDELWRVGTYLDTDLDPTTGYNGNFLAVGADHFFEAGTVSEFAAGSQSEWAWSETATDVPFDQTSMLDKEIAIPRESIGDPDAFDFLLFANNYCCDFQLPDDVYPDEALGLGGDLFTYELGEFIPTVVLQAGDADQDLKFDQRDLVRVQIAAKYLSGQAATWGDGDWDGAPGGEPGSPPAGNGRFDQLDIVSALAAGTYLTGPYAALVPAGTIGDQQTSIVYHADTGELAVDAPAGTELTSINIDSAAGVFTGQSTLNLGGSFDNDADNNIFKATFGSSFASLSFGNVAQPGLSEDFLLGDLAVIGSLAGGGDLGDVDLVYIPEPTAACLLAIGLLSWVMRFYCSRR
jgi:hypothetical protein